MKHTRTIAVTSLFRGDITRQTLLDALEYPLKSSLLTENKVIYEWKFDITAAQKLLDFIASIDPFSEHLHEVQERVMRDGIKMIDGEYLFGQKINVVETDGFRVEILVYEDEPGG
jgi:hypothetical protein